jgi:hypothetical protein
MRYAEALAGTDQNHPVTSGGTAVDVTDLVALSVSSSLSAAYFHAK